MSVETKEITQLHEEESNPLLEFQQHLREVCELLQYSESVYDLLKEPLRFFKVRIPVRMDDGTTQVFTGFRAQHNDAVGPTKGGIRFHPEVTEEEVKALAGWMSLKCGIANLPYGGGKGGVICDPRQMSTGELERLSRGYVRAISQIVGPTKDIPAPDVFTNPQIMAWMMDEYSEIREFESPGFITGKPLVLGGSVGRETATSKGLYHIYNLITRMKGIPAQEARVIIQGFGNVGSYLANFLHEQGARVVGIGDANGAIYKEDGLDIPSLLDRRDSFGAVTHLFADKISNQELLEKPCDILIPAALGGQITKDNAARLACKIVIEAANGPTTAEAESILQERGIVVVPDILANSGGVIVSYFEWVQNNQGFYWDIETVDKLLQEKMEESFRKAAETSQQYGVSMRKAVYMVAVRRLAEAARVRGWVQ
ncbi:MAG TPA: Glu/Leu/Phe/Val dehydrogenase [Candidatus Bathyarchaeia archaeon]|nr:Glu/Leu/Phe/Val dehydrogenase [Candidatus Bathyarchaeia archaeon]